MCHHLLELGRWFVFQRRVQALAIVELVDEVADAGLGFFEGLVLVEIDLFVFEGSDEALGFGVVIGIAAPTHADPYAGFTEGVYMGFRGILHAPVGVIYQTLRRGSGSQGTVQGGKGQAGPQGVDPAPIRCIVC